MADSHPYLRTFVRLLAAAPVVTALIAAVIGVPLLRLRGHYLAFATLALHLILLAFLFAQSRFTGGQDPGLGVLEPLDVCGWTLTGPTGPKADLAALERAADLAKPGDFRRRHHRRERALGALRARTLGARRIGANPHAERLDELSLE